MSYAPHGEACRCLRLSATVLFALVLAACYRYEPSAAVQPSTGDDVRLTLSTGATDRLAPVLGPRTTSLTGHIVADEGGAYVLGVDRTFKDDGVAVVWGGDRVTIPRTGIAKVELRVLDRNRTLLTTGGIIVSAIVSAFVLSKYRSGAGSNEGITPPPPP